MKPIRYALGAFALACLASTASATTVEVAFAISVNSKVTAHIQGGVRSSVTEALAQPVTFSKTFRIDLAQVDSQWLSQPPDDVASAWTFFDHGTSSPVATPFSGLLQLPAPAGATVNVKNSLSYGMYQLGLFQNVDQPLTAVRQANFRAENNWQAYDVDGEGTVTDHLYTQNIIFEEDGSPLSSNQFARLTGDDALAFLRTQVNMVYRDAYSESGWRISQANDPDEWPGSYQSNAISYKGDVWLMSVSAVPEPGAMALSLFGLGVVALYAGRRRGQAARLAR